MDIDRVIYEQKNGVYLGYGLGNITITVLLTDISMNVHRCPTFDIMSLHLSLFMSSLPVQHSEKFDLRTSHINLVQDNTKIIIRPTNLSTLPWSLTLLLLIKVNT